MAENYRTDSKIKFCKSCKRVWCYGIARESRYCYDERKRIIYYSEIPSIGKKRHTCPSCKDQNIKEVYE